jgi:hypothetical protein
VGLKEIVSKQWLTKLKLIAEDLMITEKHNRSECHAFFEYFFFSNAYD